jgi:hypothetical protein
MPVNLETPYTFENSSNPWIMDPKSLKGFNELLVLDNQIISAEYMWSLDSKQREDLLERVFTHYRKNGFPYETLSDEEICSEFNKLVKFNERKVLTSEGFISNSGDVCLSLCRHFCKDLFYKARGDSKTMSMEDVFNDDVLFKKVLKNRMGWNTSKEDGTERPYMFGISDSMIRNGIKNSGYGYGVSNFRPTIAKFLYKRYLGDCKGKSIFDYSAGWGARALAALSVGAKYYGTDPLTYECVNELFNYFDSPYGFCLDHGSQETQDIVETILGGAGEKVDLVLSCPPYFTLERYSDKETQCYNENTNYQDWLENYWRNTVKTGYELLKDEHMFVLIIKDQYKNFSLKDDMSKILEEEGFEKYEELQYKTSKNHLSGKIKTGENTKNSEYVLAFKKK